MIRQPDNNYRLDHAVTARQKDILRAFDMNEQNIRKQAIQINDQLTAVETSGGESCMRGNRITLDEKIEKQKEIVSRNKDRYDASVEELHKLIEKRNAIRNKEPMEAVGKSNRSYEEIMRFLLGDASSEDE